jgi:hypothetical protein
MNSKFLYFSVFFIIGLQFTASTQVDHWETVVFADDIWSYRIGSSEPPNDWMQAGFDDGNWATGPGGFGYGDDDDNTIIDPTLSLYIRTDFDIVD